MVDSDQGKVTYLAETDSRGKRVLFGIKSEDRSKHVYAIGKTGMGKSTLLENMAVQDIRNGNGLAFVDPHGGTAEKLLEYIPEERIKDVLYFAPFDMDYPISFNIMEDIGIEKRHLVVNGLMSVFEKIWEDAWSARMAYILQNTLLALLEYPGATLLAVNRMYTDKSFRNKVVENVTDVSVKSFWIDEYAKYTDKYTQEATPAIQNKIGQFAGNPLIRNIIGQPKSSFNVRQIMDEKKILIVNLSKGRVGEGNARLLGSMLITKIYLAAMSRADEKANVLAKLPQFYLFVDEFQSFADKSFADILSEARKYKLNLTMAHQYIEQMEEEVREAVFGNVGTMIAFRVGAYDADVLEKEFAPTFIAEDLVNLGLRQIYIKLMIDSVTSQPFSASTLPPIELPEVSYVDEIITNSRKTFAKARAEVEKSIIDWHEEGREGTKTMPTKSPSSKPVPKVSLPIDIRGKKVTAPSPLLTHPNVSLESLKEKNNNQRKPDAKHIADLRDALKVVMGNPPIRKAVEPPLGGSTAKSEPSPEELKKILDV
ncbi:MAG: type IV secretion system DNA-binding domain-containing protein [Candidatus Zambryskibacteria bacterium]|nr:type IV secretion system DNA-binding domain-containing protein [Candidatus Zambryskibacteria bacterium]